MPKFLIFLMSIFLCLNLGYSQTTSPPTTFIPIPIPTQVPLIGTPTINSNSISTTPQTAPVSSENSGKYDEYQSICRTNEYDNVAHLSLETQQKRILFLNEKIQNEKNPINFKLRLLKEYIDQDKPVEAEKFYTQFKQEKIADEDLKIADALYATTKKDYKKATSILEKILIENNKNKVALKYLAETYKEAKNYFESITAYTDLEKLTSESYSLELCEIYAQDSQHNEAEKACKNAVQLYKNNPYPFIYLGISTRERLNFSDSINYFKQALKVKPTEMGYTCLAEVYSINKDFLASTIEFKKAIELNPQSARAYLGLAWAQLKNKSYEESLVSFKKACEKDTQIKSEIRKAFKVLADEKSSYSKNFAELAQKCTN